MSAYVAWGTLGSCLSTHHDQKAIKNPNHEKKKTRPYLLTGFRAGIERAFWLMGLISGCAHRYEALKPMIGGVVSGSFQDQRSRPVVCVGRSSSRKANGSVVFKK